ncbi:O-acetyl-ADP-ribose deacetylase [Thalassospira sp. HF15]|uniref:O-acetyl-ADP-ribose deacetylase n=1 Tax=Thalassospira sp. HF15 TaxID=2722755 RepID=UPI00142FE8A7|nr:O-acetyl-ADP-ribose deacetylase [Thalassospira sp. HF15]
MTHKTTPDKTHAIEIILGDITTLDVDAIVNAANEALLPGGGVCGAIHRAAGPELAAACQPFAPCPTGEARITPGFGLKAKYVIHTVGPVWHGGTQGEADLLASCYRASILLAVENNLASVAFPAISTGIFGYPEDQAAKIAVSTICELTGEMPQIYLCCFSPSARQHIEAAYHQLK